MNNKNIFFNGSKSKIKHEFKNMFDYSNDVIKIKIIDFIDYLDFYNDFINHHKKSIKKIKGHFYL